MRSLFYVVLGLVLSIAVPASAHVVVSPNTAPSASYQTFVIGVPSERENATVSVHLVIPEGVESVRPNVKPGWKIDMKKKTEGEKTLVTEVVWSGGSVPAGLRDEFIFSAKTPSSGSLVWKAYQTYADGTIVAWDTDPAEHGHGAIDHSKGEAGPASLTTLTAPADHDHAAASPHAGHDSFLPIVATAIAFGSFLTVMQQKKKQG